MSCSLAALRLVWSSGTVRRERLSALAGEGVTSRMVPNDAPLLRQDRRPNDHYGRVALGGRYVQGKHCFYSSAASVVHRHNGPSDSSRNPSPHRHRKKSRTATRSGGLQGPWLTRGECQRIGDSNGQLMILPGLSGFQPPRVKSFSSTRLLGPKRQDRYLSE